LKIIKTKGFHVLYSDAHEIVFVHQRKAAGTSVKSMFYDAASDFNDGILDPNWDSNNDRIKNYLKFTVIRNPWDRFISGWKYLKSTRHRSIENVLLNLPKDNLIDNILYDKSLKAKLAYTKELATRTSSRLNANVKIFFGQENIKIPHNQGHDYRHITRQQYESVYYPDGILAVDKVIFLEDLNHGLNEVFRVVKNGNLLTPQVRLNQKRIADDYRKYFNDKTLELFNSIFAQDISIWGYQFDSGPGVPPQSFSYNQIDLG
jgi:hypothetical protein